MATPLVMAIADAGSDPNLQSAVPEMSLGSSAILFDVDDDAFIYAAAKALRAAGYEVWLARDHRTALQILESPQPLDLLITDVVMPNSINGFALARMARLRRLDLKILYMTAYDVSVEEAITKVLRKPLSLERLVIEARLALAGRS